MNEIPRRAYVNKMIPAELAIRAAMLEVEELPASVLLTEAVNLLAQAKDKVADWYDGSLEISRKEEEG